MFGHSSSECLIVHLVFPLFPSPLQTALQAADIHRAIPVIEGHIWLVIEPLTGRVVQDPWRVNANAMQTVYLHTGWLQPLQVLLTVLPHSVTIRVLDVIEEAFVVANGVVALWPTHYDLVRLPERFIGQEPRSARHGALLSPGSQRVHHKQTQVVPCQIESNTRESTDISHKSEKHHTLSTHLMPWGGVFSLPHPKGKTARQSFWCTCLSNAGFVH